MASSGEIADCNQPNTPPSPLPLQVWEETYGGRHMLVATSIKMSLSTTAVNSQNMSSDEVTLDRYLEIAFSS